MPSRQIVLFVAALLLAVPALAQDVSPGSVPTEAVTLGAEVAPETPDVPPDEFNRGTPRRSFVGFMTAVEAGDWESAVEYLDLRNLPDRYDELKPVDLAQGLAIVIQRKLWIDPVELSDRIDG